jgi:uncharacterized cupredoxin-like copper-binding protein
MKRTLSALAATAVAATAFVVLAPFANARTTTTTITVKAKEFKFILSKKKARHGKVTFKVTNTGTIAHDFKIAGKKTKLLQPHKTATLTVTLKKGKHPYTCTVPGHSAAGMKGVFTST